jgi:riboflavin synthase
MFTGIIKGMGTVREVRRVEQGAVLCFEAPTFLMPAVGDSLAVNGCCLTAQTSETCTWSAQLSPETLDRTTLGSLQPGDRVNMEQPLTLQDLLGGHLVLGHVDGVGMVVAMEPQGANHWLRIRAPAEVLPFLAVKGSVAVDGMSLTIAHLEGDIFSIALIPHTLHVTIAQWYHPGTAVNLEADCLARYVKRLMEGPFVT